MSVLEHIFTGNDAVFANAVAQACGLTGACDHLEIYVVPGPVTGELFLDVHSADEGNSWRIAILITPPNTCSGLKYLGYREEVVNDMEAALIGAALKAFCARRPLPRVRFAVNTEERVH